MNKGSQIAPAKVQRLDNGDIVIAFDITTSGLHANSIGTLYSFAQGHLNIPYTDIDIEAADMNGDKKVTISDANDILQVSRVTPGK